jgi:RNA polymerase sigma-70 factor (ECF subfamily)
MTADLIRRFRSGDREAFTTLYRLHHPAVFRFALHMTGDRPQAEEVTQDVFVWLIDNSVKFDSERGELSAFLVGVTRRFLQKRYQKQKRFVPFERIHDRAQPEASAEPDTEDLRRAILALPPRYREVVVLCDLEGKSYEEASALVECALGTVRSRLHRARALLARKLRIEALSGEDVDVEKRCAV